MSLSSQLDDSRNSGHEGSPQTPLETLENNTLALDERAADSLVFFHRLISLFYQGASSGLPYSLKAKCLCQAVDKVVKRRSPAPAVEVTYRTTTHSIIIDYSIGRAVTFSARLEVLAKDISAAYTFKNIVAQDLLVPQIYAHLDFLEKETEALLEEITRVYLYLLASQPI